MDRLTLYFCILIACSCVYAENILGEQLPPNDVYKNLDQVWVPGKDAGNIQPECMAKAKISHPTRSKRLIGPTTHQRIIEFIPSTDPAKAVIQGTLLNATVWLPIRLVQQAESVHFLYCSNGNLLKEKIFKHKRPRVYHDTKSWRPFEIGSLVEDGKKKAAHGFIVAILNYATDYPMQHQSQDTASPKPWFQISYVETRKLKLDQEDLKQDHTITTRICDDQNASIGPLSNCCLRKIEVDFAKIGWHWVEHPKTMIIHYCDGYCPHPYSGGNMVDNEASFLAFIRGARPAVGQICCVAASYKSHWVSVRTQRQGTTVKMLEDLDAASCVCIS